MIFKDNLAISLNDFIMYYIENMNADFQKYTMSILKETLNFADCLLKKCNKENKEFLESDIYKKFTEDYNKMETNADRKKIIKLIINNDKYINLTKCKYDNCYINMKTLLSIVIKILPIMEQTVKIAKTPADVVKSIAIINDPKNKKVSSEIYIKKYQIHHLNITTYLKLLTLKSKKLKN